MDTKIPIEQLIEFFDQGENVADYLSQPDLEEIGVKVYRDYELDLASRSDWEDKNNEWMKLALQVYGKKNTPWENASNVKFPLVTIGATQFSSRAYPALIDGPDIVKCRVIGSDVDGAKRASADRVSRHMSYQVLEEDESWEEETDKMLLSLAILGDGFKKSYFDSSKGHNVSENVLAMDLVVNYYAKSLETASTITHVIEKTKNEIIENTRLGVYKEVNLPQPAQDPTHESRNERQGLTPSGDAPYKLLEQCRYLDLDGDGYEEPYTVLIEKSSKKVLRISPRFSSDDVIIKGDVVLKINPIHYYTKFVFIPSPDGGFYDLGLGALLGPVNEAVNTMINQLIDSGTLNNLQGGFMGRGARLTGGRHNFKPGEWKVVNATGDDLRKSIVPLPVNQPSAVLFNMLSLLIDYGERISSVSDLMVGQTPGQNTPATTSMAALEQGMKVFTGIYKRLYRSFTEEFRKLYRLNRLYLNPEQYFTVLDEGEPKKIFQQDYTDDVTNIRPAADPNIASDTQRLMKAEAIKQAAMTSPGYNLAAVEKRYLESMQIPNINEICPIVTDENGQPQFAIQPPPNPEIMLEQAKMQKEYMDSETKRILALAQIVKLEADAMLSLAKAEAEEDGIQLDFYRAKIEELKVQKEKLNEKPKQK